MARKLSLTQIRKYDVTQKVLEALADAQSRAILFSLIKKGKTAADLAKEHDIPLSTVYKKLTDLEELTLVNIEKWIMTDSGRRLKVYRSRISQADITIKKTEPNISLSPN